MFAQFDENGLARARVLLLQTSSRQPGFVTSSSAATSNRPSIRTSPTFNGSSEFLAIIMINMAAAASPVGSEVFYVTSLLVIGAGVLLLERHFLPLRATPAYLLVPIFFALGLPASIVLLVPIDLASSARDTDVGSRGIWLPDRVLLVSWRISYWLTFVLTW